MTNIIQRALGNITRKVGADSDISPREARADKPRTDEGAGPISHTGNVGLAAEQQPARPSRFCQVPAGPALAENNAAIIAAQAEKTDRFAHHVSDIQRVLDDASLLGPLKERMSPYDGGDDGALASWTLDAAVKFAPVSGDHLLRTGLFITSEGLKTTLFHYKDQSPRHSPITATDLARSGYTPGEARDMLERATRRLVDLTEDEIRAKLTYVFAKQAAR